MTPMDLGNHQYKANAHYLLRKANEGVSIFVFLLLILSVV